MTVIRLFPVALATAMSVSTPQHAPAQGPTFPVQPIATGSAPDAQFAEAIAWIGDLDGDQHDDVVIAAEEEDVTGVGARAGVVRVYSGAAVAAGTPGTPLFTLTGSFIGDRFGSDVADAGDVDGDGIPDIAIGIRGLDRLVAPFLLDSGGIAVHSGADGSLLFRAEAQTETWAATDDVLGFRVAGVGDVDNDGFADVAMAGYGAAPGGLPAQGAVLVYSGRTSVGNPAPTPLYTFAGPAVQSFLGFALAGAGDVDRDGYDDVVAGGVGGAGVAIVWSGRDGTVLHTLTSSTGNPAYVFGASVAGIGDVDNDGHDDIAVGEVSLSTQRGAVYVFSGQTGQQVSYSPIRGFVVGDLYGFTVEGSAGADTNGDGVPDFAVGAILDSGSFPVSGTVTVYSGADGTQVAKIGGQAIGGAFGFATAFGGDFDNDGHADLLVGAPFESPGGNNLAGAAYVALSTDASRPPRARVEYLGVGCPAPSGRQPKITVRGRAAFGQSFELLVRGGEPSQRWVANLAALQQPPVDLAPFMPGCTLYVEINGFILDAPSKVTDLDGKIRWVSPPVPVEPALAGQSIGMQFVISSPGTNSASLIASDAVELVLGF